MPSDRDLPELHDRALASAAGFVAAVRPEQLGQASVCAGWTVADLLNHVVAGNWWVPELVAGKTIAEIGDRLDGDLLGDDHVGAYDASAKAAGGAFAEPGAMDRPVAVSYGPVPGSVYCGHRFIDVLIHGWDLAVSTGQSATLDRTLVEACWQVVEPQLDVIQGSGAYGGHVDVADGAPLQTKLLAALGRTG